MTATPPPSGGDDIDAEFRRLMESVDLDASLLDPPDSSSPHAPDPAPASTPIAIVATPLASAKVLAGVIRLAVAAGDDAVQIPAGVVTVDSPSGAIAVGVLSEEEAKTLAHLTSLGMQRQGIVVFWREGDRMVATRYRYGRHEGDVSPALVMGALDDRVEDLLLGLDSLDDIGPSYDPAVLTREEATEWVAGAKPKRRWGRPKDTE